MCLFKKKKLYKITYTKMGFSSGVGNYRYKTAIVSAKNEARPVNKFSRDWCHLSYVITSITLYKGD